MIDLLLHNAGEIFDGDRIIEADSLAIADGRITWIGRGEPAGVTAQTRRIDLAGALVTPGLVDPHTHLVFGGDRADEYALRATGTSYVSIAEAGGGIARTMRATREASVDQLCALAHPRLANLLSFGVTTAEVKSGYGLDTATELKMLRVIKRLDDEQPIDLVGTFLGAHTLPPEHKARPDAYVDLVCEEMIPAVAEEGLADFCDVFVERSAFSVKQGERVLRCGVEHGLRPKVHAEQLSHTGGAAMAAHLGAVSADHLEHLTEDDVAALAEAGTVAVLLPGASVFLGDDHRPPTQALRAANVAIALSTDCNPGTCMTENLLLMLTLGMSRLGLSPLEVLRAVTRHAAAAIGRGKQAGRLAVGRVADIAVFDTPSHRHLPYHFGINCTRMVFKNGRLVHPAPIDA